MRIVYGKAELQPEEINWLKELDYVRTSFCKNLHAKCYLNESMAIITSLNLYEFSQVNNNEMGILIERDGDSELYGDAHEEAQRIIRVSDEVRMSLEKIVIKEPKVSEAEEVKEAFQKMREIFLSQLVYQTYSGYVFSQFKKLEQDLRSKDDIRWKHAMHLIRLLLSGITVLKDGFVPVRIEAYRPQLLAIRNQEMPWMRSTSGG